ncbi:beta family protein [Streptosporangium longisporum]|uniref:T4 beta protein n=1 Tax=Streptosporangium longisporum TaxID=46187 RepID=A0ABN3XX01_9ACTN
MTVYMPILRGRAGDFLALGKVAEELRPFVRALIEVMPAERTRDDENRTVLQSVAVFEERVEEHLPAERVFAVDCRPVLDRYGHPHGCGAVTMVSNVMERLGRRIIPVLRPTDEDCEFRDAGLAARRHGRGACLRVPWAGPRTAAEDARLSRRMDRLANLRFTDVDLVIDLWAVDSDARLRNRTNDALRSLRWASRFPMRSITVASGAFPRDLDAMPFGAPVPVPRRDAALYRTVAASHPGVFYGDYGVSSPRAEPRTPHPELRYTFDDYWYVYRCERGDGAGAPGGFDDLCKAVVADLRSARGVASSWGDQEIERFAAGQPLLPRRPGSWYACGMSHHVATVVDRLNRLGRP